MNLHLRPDIYFMLQKARYCCKIVYSKTKVLYEQSFSCVMSGFSVQWLLSKLNLFLWWCMVLLPFHGLFMLYWRLSGVWCWEKSDGFIPFLTKTALSCFFFSLMGTWVSDYSLICCLSIKHAFVMTSGFCEGVIFWFKLEGLDYVS